jgi:hypothetical protein
MSKNFVLSFFLVIFGVTPAYATDLCQDGEIKIEPDWEVPQKKLSGVQVDHAAL